MLNAGQKCCRMLHGEHSAILLTFIKLQFVIKIFILSIFERPFYTGFTVVCKNSPLIVTALYFFEGLVLKGDTGEFYINTVKSSSIPHFEGECL